MKIKKINQSAGVIANVIDSLESNSSIDALSANKGKELQERINEVYNTSNYILGTPNAIGQWINQKTIYRTVVEWEFSISSNIVVSNHIDLPANVGTIVHFYGQSLLTTGGKTASDIREFIYPINSGWEQTEFSRVYIVRNKVGETSPEGIYYDFGCPYTGTVKMTVVLEYTERD